MGIGLSAEDTYRSQPVVVVRGRLYRILDFIGRGSEATVYRCEDQTAAEYAVKIYDFSRYPSPYFRSKIDGFNKEARILQYLGGRSRHFVYLYDYEYKPEENLGYMIMELGDGSLRQQLDGFPLNPLLRKMYWKQIVSILRELQDAHVVHADIKPDNMILVDNVLKVTDLGLAFRVASPVQTVRRQTVRGTLDYMAPEVFAHKTGFKSDVWSAGIILYEMTYGRPPFFGFSDRNQKVAAISSRMPIQYPPHRDPYLVDCMKRCLKSDARLRPSAFELQLHPFSRS